MFNREQFSELSVASQVRSVMRNLYLIVEEVPLVIFRLEEIIASLDVSLSLAEFQFTFYNVASKIVKIFFEVPVNYYSYFLFVITKLCRTKLSVA